MIHSETNVVVKSYQLLTRSCRDLLNMAKKRTNVVPIIEDARHPHKYRMLVPMVDCVFADVAQPDQVNPQLQVEISFKNILLFNCFYEPILYFRAELWL